MPVLRNKVRRQAVREELYAKLADGGVEIPEAVKQLRKILGLSQVEFAKKIGVSLSTLRKVEQAHGNTTLATLAKIFDPFQLRLVVRPSPRG